MDAVYHTHGCVMVAVIVPIAPMSHRIVAQQIEHVQWVCGDVTMVDASVLINVAMVSTIAGKSRVNL